MKQGRTDKQQKSGGKHRDGYGPQMPRQNTRANNNDMAGSKDQGTGATGAGYHKSKM